MADTTRADADKADTKKQPKPPPRAPKNETERLTMALSPVGKRFARQHFEHLAKFDRNLLNRLIADRDATRFLAAVGHAAQIRHDDLIHRNRPSEEVDKTVREIVEPHAGEPPPEPPPAALNKKIDEAITAYRQSADFKDAFGGTGK